MDKIIIIGSDEDPNIIKQKRWDAAFMDSAIRFSQLSHCTRYQVGCIMVIERRPIAIGINGSPPSQPNCDSVFTSVPEPDHKDYKAYKKIHGDWSYENEHHAEANAIDWCARKGISTQGATIYTTLSACMPCAKTMVFAGIYRFVYLETYDREQTGLAHLKKNGIAVDKIGEVSSYFINPA